MVHMIALIQINSLVDFEGYRAKVSATLDPYRGEIRFRAEKNHNSRQRKRARGGFSDRIGQVPESKGYERLVCVGCI